MSARELPPGLPPPPSGAVYLPEPLKGKGPFYGWSLLTEEGRWDEGEWYGTNPDLFYAAPADSEIARLNGYGAPADTEKGSEAVALVRKLAESLKHMTVGTECFAVHIKAKGDDPIEGHCAHARLVLTEAEAFLAREGKS